MKLNWKYKSIQGFKQLSKDILEDLEYSSMSKMSSQVWQIAHRTSRRPRGRMRPPPGAATKTRWVFVGHQLQFRYLNSSEVSERLFFFSVFPEELSLRGRAGDANPDPTVSFISHCTHLKFTFSLAEELPPLCLTPAFSFSVGRSLSTAGWWPSDSARGFQNGTHSLLHDFRASPACLVWNWQWSWHREYQLLT